MQLRITIERLDDAGEYVDTILTLPVSAEQVAEIVPDLLTSALGVEVAAAEPGSPTAAMSAGSTPKRTRRTKAQIAADKAREEATAEQPAADPASPTEPEQPLNQTPGFDTAPTGAFAVPTSTFNPFQPKA